MIFNYKKLNDNIEDDKYSLPNNEAWINKIKITFNYNKFFFYVFYCYFKSVSYNIVYNL